MRVLAIESDRVQVAFYAWADQQAGSFYDLESGARQAVKEALLAASVSFPRQQIVVHGPDTGTTRRAAQDEEEDDLEEPLLEAHVREERAAPGERDLLSEGPFPPT
jgi:hypothetical protein